VGASMTVVASPLDNAMARVGDRWTLQVVEALLEGPRRFSELQQSVPAVATNVLSARLRRLEADGLVVAFPYSSRPPRYSYRLTDAGAALAGAVVLLTGWGAGLSGSGAGHTGTDAAAPSHAVCGTGLEPRWYCPTCARTAEPGDELVWL